MVCGGEGDTCIGVHESSTRLILAPLFCKSHLILKCQSLGKKQSHTAHRVHHLSSHLRETACTAPVASARSLTLQLWPSTLSTSHQVASFEYISESGCNVFIATRTPVYLHHIVVPFLASYRSPFDSLNRLRVKPLIPTTHYNCK